jgi:uncharacterized membrane protein YcaP (DUF421 family)
MWQLAIPPLELVVRSILVYLIFFVALRVFGKREVAQFTPWDLALVLVGANALQPAITGPDASIPGAAIIVATLFLLNRAVAMARRHFPIVRRLLEPAATVIGQDGHWLPQALSREDLDDEDLEAALREHGLSSVMELKLATLEEDGTISVVTRAGQMRMRTHRRFYRRGA